MEIRQVRLRDSALLPAGVPKPPTLDQQKVDPTALHNWIEKYHKSITAPLQQQFAEIRTAVTTIMGQFQDIKDELDKLKGNS